MSVNNILRTQRLLAKIQKLKRYFQIHNIDERHPRFERMRRLMSRYKNTIARNKDIQEEFEGLEEAIYSDKPQKDYLRLTEKKFLKKKKKEDDSEEKRFIIKKKKNEEDDDEEEDNDKDNDKDNDEGDEDGVNEKKRLTKKKEKIIINPFLKKRV
jgi:hypothetical protein